MKKISGEISKKEFEKRVICIVNAFVKVETTVLGTFYTISEHEMKDYCKFIGLKYRSVKCYLKGWKKWKMGRFEFGRNINIDQEFLEKFIKEREEGLKEYNYYKKQFELEQENGKKI